MSDSPERRVRRGCSWVLVLLLVVTAVSVAENGWTGLTTLVLLGLLAFNIVILVVVNLPQEKK